MKMRLAALVLLYDPEPVDAALWIMAVPELPPLFYALLHQASLLAWRTAATRRGGHCEHDLGDAAGRDAGHAAAIAGCAMLARRALAVLREDLGDSVAFPC